MNPMLAISATVLFLIFWLAYYSDSIITFVASGLAYLIYVAVVTTYYGRRE